MCVSVNVYMCVDVYCVRSCTGHLWVRMYVLLLLLLLLICGWGKGKERMKKKKEVIGTLL